MLELGNKKNDNGVYKHYFRELGFTHVSIDWNGDDGALALDLRDRIEMDPFDIITNFGTTEHVSNQYAVWENIHRLVKVGGIMVSTTPLPGDWLHHGEYYPTTEFFREFPGFKIEKIGIERTAPRRLVCVRMRKIKNTEFHLPDHIYYNDSSRVKSQNHS